MPSEPKDGFHYATDKRSGVHVFVYLTIWPRGSVSLSVCGDAHPGTFQDFSDFVPIPTESEVKEMRETIEKLEKSELELIDERDGAEEALSQAFYLVTGRSPEWSNLFGHDQAHMEISETVNLLKLAALSHQAKESEASNEK